MRFKVIIFSVIISILGFLGFYTNSYCEALPDFILDPNSFEVLNGGAFSNQYQYGLTNDVGQMAFVYGVDAALQQINTDLYNKYGWDLEDAAWAIEDELLENAGTGQSADTFVQNMSDGAVLSWVAANSENIRLFSSWLVNPIGAGTRQLKQYIMGKVNQDNEIVDVYDNTITYVDDDFFDVYQSTYDSLVLSDDIIVLSDSQLPYYGKNLQYNAIYRNNFNGFKQVVADYDLFLYTEYVTVNGYSGYTVYAVIPYSQYVESVNTGYQWRFNGNIYTYNTTHTLTSTANYITLGYTNSIRPYTFVINGVTYAYGPLSTSNAQNGNFSQFDMGSLQNVKDMIEALSDSAYSYIVEPTVAEEMQDTLNLLKGHWVDSSDMARINEFIGDLPVSPELPNGAVDYLPFIGASESDLAELQELVEDILARSQAYDDVLGDPDPTPEPEPEPEPDPDPVVDYTGTIVPDNFPTGITEPILDLFDFNFNLFSFFEPLFYIFGTFSGIFALWSFVPLVIIILVVIWALK